MADIVSAQIVVHRGRCLHPREVRLNRGLYSPVTFHTPDAQFFSGYKDAAADSVLWVDGPSSGRFIDFRFGLFDALEPQDCKSSQERGEVQGLRVVTDPIECFDDDTVHDCPVAVAILGDQFGDLPRNPPESVRPSLQIAVSGGDGG